MSEITTDVLRSLRGKPCVYAAQSHDRRWIKFGFSTHITDRLASIDQDYRAYAPFTPLGVCLSTWRTEHQIHRAFRPIRSKHSREIFPALSAVRMIADLVVEQERLEPLSVDDYCDLRQWSRSVVRMRAAV